MPGVASRYLPAGQRLTDLEPVSAIGCCTDMKQPLHRILLCVACVNPPSETANIKRAAPRADVQRWGAFLAQTLAVFPRLFVLSIAS